MVSVGRIQRQGTMTLGEFSSTLASQLSSALRLEGEFLLADVVAFLPIVRRCCNDEHCAGFYTSDAASQEIAARSTRIILGGVPGLSSVFAIDGSIVMIELLNRPDVRETLDEYFG